jgi:hypothetical protein
MSSASKGATLRAKRHRVAPIVTAGLMQWPRHKVQRISCIKNTKLESKGEGNASTFSSALVTSSLLARFRRVSSRIIFAANYVIILAITLPPLLEEF